jgi:hypothetical protein
MALMAAQRLDDDDRGEDSDDQQSEGELPHARGFVHAAA